MINNENLYEYHDKYLKTDLIEVNNIKLKDRIHLLEDEPDPESAWAFFISSFLYVIGRKSNLYFTENNTEEQNSNDFELLYEKLIYKRNTLPNTFSEPNKESYSIKHRIFAFYRSEIKRIEDLKNEHIKKLEAYHAQLESYLPRLRAINFYLERLPYNAYNHLDFPEYFEGKVEKGFLNVKTLDYNLRRLFVQMDLTAYLELLSHKPADRLMIQKEFQKVFNFTEYKSPMIFIEYPRQLAQYKIMLKNWLLKEIEKRKRQFNLDEDTLPQSFKLIVDFANKLMEPADRDYLTKNTPEYLSYPEHIFGSFKAFKLFEWFAKHLHNGSQFTFLYRHMRMEEKDFQIKVDPAPFEDWFYMQSYKKERFKVNGTLEKVSRPERVNTYNMTKELIMELYPST